VSPPVQGSRPLLDLHDLGLHQTGNESWARCLSAALFELDGPGSYDIAVTTAAPPEDLSLLPARHRVLVSGSSARRLGVDLPREMGRLKTSVVLVQYTVPVSRVPAVVMVHDLSFEDPRAAEWLPLATRLRYRTTVRASVRSAAHLLTVSEFSKADLVRVYGIDPARVTVVPNAVDPRLAELLDVTAESRSDRPTVLMVGNVLPRKNLPVVARAVRLMRDRGLDVHLRVVGSVHKTGRGDAEQAQHLLGGAVTFTGYVTRGDLAREYRSAHVLAFPSLFEGFGIPALEAMRARLPIVVSDRTALPEVVHDAGLVVSAEDVDAWTAALLKVLQEPEADMAERARKRERNYRWRSSAMAVRNLMAGVYRDSSSGERGGRQT
jgi:glycosyltransferase involved in cell wall biosynthesis